MKSLAAAVVAICVVGCTSHRAVSYQKLEQVQVGDYQCANADQYIAEVQQQLKYKGLIGKNPEDLNEADRQYNSRARVIIWSLRIGCNNPGFILK
ncbi:hypothetical protein [Flavobacterium sp.]|jgi:hypothetical protein|uniref:hypothetical protein n=1 Tax=Flavobacterium sp. TaxID=239 RepID=UPI0037C15DAE